MIDVRVGQQHGIQLARVESEARPVQLFEFARPLEQAAVNQYFGVMNLKQIGGASYCSCPTQEGELRLR